MKQKHFLHIFIGVLVIIGVSAIFAPRGETVFVLEETNSIVEVEKEEKVYKELPLAKQKTFVPLKIGVITDTQMGMAESWQEGQSPRLRNEHQKMLDDFSVHMKQFDPAFVVHMGDVIEGTKVPTSQGMQETQLVKDGIDVGKDVYWIVGNHDLRSMTREEFKSVLGIDYDNTFFDYEDKRFVFVDADYDKFDTPHSPNTTENTEGFVPQATIAWLEDVLSTDQKIYVFMHHSVVDRDYVSKRPVQNHREVEELFHAKNVRAVFSGHIEKEYRGMFKGVEYFTMPGTNKNPGYQGTFYELTIDEENVHVDMYRQDRNRNIHKTAFTERVEYDMFSYEGAEAKTLTKAE